MKRSLKYLLACTMLAGCGKVISSMPQEGLGAQQTDVGTGVIYALPKSLYSMTVTLGSVPVYTPAEQKVRAALQQKAKALGQALVAAANDPKKKKLVEAQIAKNTADLVAITKKAKKVQGLSTSAKELAVIPDSAQTFRAHYEHQIQSDDEVAIEVKDGLLTKIETTAKDRSADIIAKIAGAAVDLVVFAGTGGISGGVPKGPAAPAPCQTQSNFTISATIDPAQPKQVQDLLNEASSASTGESCLVVEVFDDAGQKIFPKLDRLGLPLPEATSLAGSPAPGQCAEGICYRNRGWVLYRVSHRNPTVRGAVGFISAPQLGPVGKVEFRRGAFVEAKASAQFDRGMLTSVSYTDPSELLAFIEIPVNLIERIVSIPSKLIDTEQGQLDAQKANLTAQAAIVEQQINLLDAERRLAALQALDTTTDVID